MTANTMMQKFAVGDTYGPNEDGIWRAGISAPRWGNRVEVYGENQADAESLRDEILAAWQAAQSVPVVGEPVAWIRKDQLQHVNTFGPALCHVYATEQPGTVALHEKPTTSITAQELDALRKDAERYRWLRSSSVGPATIWNVCMEHLDGGLQTLKSDYCLDEAIDAAIQERQS